MELIQDVFAQMGASAGILARWDVVLALLVGLVGGVLIGAIPGVGPAVAIAILLPVTFSMDPIVGLTVLLGIYGRSMYGTSIPAILINTPGTAVNALTTYDGYPMTTRGAVAGLFVVVFRWRFQRHLPDLLCACVGKNRPDVWVTRDLSGSPSGHHPGGHGAS